jgi:ketosteroid isomerase-like protein
MRKCFTIVLVLIAMLPLLTVSSPASAEQDEATVDPGGPVAIVRALYEGINAGDLEAAMTYIADNAVSVNLPPPPGVESATVGKEAIRELNATLIAAHSQTDIIDPQVHGDAVTYRALVEDDFMRVLGVAPLEFTVTSIVQDGLLQSETWVMSPQSLARVEAALSFQDAVATGNEAFMSAFGEGDAAGLSTLYTEEGQALPPNGDAAMGHEAIQTIWQGAFDNGATGVTLETVEVQSAGEFGYEVGQFTIMAGDQVADEGKYIAIWKFEDGQWKLHRNIWNSSRSVEN